jgi:uncharacterized cupin superfamily protein
MPEAKKAAAIWALEAALRSRPSAYPEQFQPVVKGREKRQLGDHFGLRNFGVNLTRLAPGAQTALRHAHTKQDEFVYVVEGYPVLLTNDGEEWLSPGMCAGFPAGTGNAHHLVNRTGDDVVLLEIGDRTPGDEANYPDDDIRAELVSDNIYRFTRKDGTPYG